MRIETRRQELVRKAKQLTSSQTDFVALGPEGSFGYSATPFNFIWAICRYMQPQRVGLFSRFGHKEGIDFGHLVLNRVGF